MKKIILTVLGTAYMLCAFSQSPQGKEPDTASFYNLSIEELLNVEISVASKKALTLRESPGIVTLITQDEIRNSGAHDIMEVLSLVPGLHFGVDVEGVVGIGVRGNWGHEGKVLLMLDGQEMNEQLFGSLQFGEHYPIDQIRKIEIIRGPGSSVYGGNAAYAVINIITNNNPDFEGFSASGSYGQMSKTFAARSISANGGHHFGDFAVNLGIYSGEANRSQFDYSDYGGSSYDMTQNSGLRNCMMNLNTSYKGLSFRVLGDYYMVENRDGYDLALMRKEPVKFNSTFMDLKYDWKLSKKFSVVPQLKYRDQTPWKVKGDVSPDDVVYHKEALRPQANLTLHYIPSNAINIDGGVEYYIDQGIDHEGGKYLNGKSYIDYYNSAYFLQGLWSNKIANLTLGVRYHLNNYFDPSFVPRIGITKVIKKAHFKLLYSAAYRTPSIENVRIGGDVQPEHTDVVEFETGYQFGDNSYLTANLYDITTTNAIVYSYEMGTEGYMNSGSTGTRGIELDYKFKKRFGYVDFNMAYYTARGKVKSESYQVVTDEDLLLAFPGLVANCLVNLRVNDRISINPSMSWIGERYDIAGFDMEGSNLYKKYKPVMMANLFAGIRYPKISGFSASIGCANLLNEKNRYIQPYNSNHAPLPGRAREFRITLRYDLDKSRK